MGVLFYSFLIGARLYYYPLCRHTTPVVPEAPEVPKHVGGQKPPTCILPFKAPQLQRNTWNEQRPPPTLARCRNPTQKRKNATGVARIRIGASWRCWRQSGAIMHPILTAP